MREGKGDPRFTAWAIGQTVEPVLGVEEKILSLVVGWLPSSGPEVLIKQVEVMSRTGARERTWEVNSHETE